MGKMREVAMAEMSPWSSSKGEADHAMARCWRSGNGGRFFRVKKGYDTECGDVVEELTWMVLKLKN